MRARPRAAFVATVSIAGALLGSACHKESKDSKKPNSSCEPPDCHMNPPPPRPEPEPDRPPTTNPPPLPSDGGTAATATATATAIATSRSGPNPPALLPDGGRRAK